MKTSFRISMAIVGVFCALLSHAAVLPTIQSVSPVPGTITALTNITVTFSTAVTNVGSSDLLIGGAPAIDVTGDGAVYTFVLQNQPGYGLISVVWDAGHNILDLEEPPNRFNENAPGASWQYNLIDQTPPSVFTLTPATGVSVRQLTQIDVAFSEPVAGVNATDLLLNGIPASALSVLGVGRYRFTFATPTSGLVQAEWATNSGIQDFASPPNVFAGGTWTYTLDPNLGVPLIRLNEFLASNLTGLADENSERHDWIELFNFGTNTVNLAGYALTDDRDDPGRWTFPATNLAPGQYLVVFASAKDRKSPAFGQRFHTNFKLNPFGDYLGLYNAESPRVVVSEFAGKFPEQRGNYSYGYDRTNALKYFATPTPGASNIGTSALTFILPPPHFNVERGYYDAPFTLILNDAVAGASIRYTTNGSEPTATTGTLYTSPLQISNTVVIRAAAFLANALPSASVTHTYLFFDQVIRQPNSIPNFPSGATVMAGYPADYEMDPEITTNALYQGLIKDSLKALPIISLVISSNDMWSPTTGIYTHPTTRGAAWEKPASMEMILQDGTTAFQVNCGLQIQGNAARDPQKQPKHPFKVLFKGDYGQSTLEYQMFPDSPVNQFDQINLRADFNFSWLHWSGGQRARGQRTRDAWMKDTMRTMGGLAGHNRYAHLYINGVYWGVYEPAERPDENFAAAYLGGDPRDYDIVNEPIVNGNTAVSGDLVAYNAMLAINNLQTLANYDAMKATLDIPQFCDYMILHFYAGHEDWGNDKNFYTLRRRGAGNQFKYVPWDGENILGTDINNNRTANPDVPSGLHTKLLLSPEYKLAFADRAHKALFNGGTLTAQAVTNRWMFRASQLNLAIIAESARWGDYRRDVHPYDASGPFELFTRNNQWLTEQGRLVNTYFPQRPGILLNQFRSAGLYPAVSAPVFNQFGGLIARGFSLTMSASNAIYFTLDGSDPRVYGTGAVSPAAQAYAAAVTLTNSVVVKARALFGTTWSALNEASFSVDALSSPLRITEIMYNPNGGDAYEYIEVQNVSSAAVNAGMWSISGVGYIFAPNTFLQPGQIIVLASDVSPASWASRYPGVPVFGRFGGKLDNGGETLAILNATNLTLWAVSYSDADGWPTVADGLGYSIEIIDPLGDQNNPANWRASGGLNGTPGASTPPPSTGPVVLNEVMAENLSAVNNGGFFSDWLELHNSGAQPVNLANWSLSDDSNPRKFVFPATNLAAGGYLVVWCDTNASVPGLRASFGLGRNGDNLILYDANTNRVDAIGFGVQFANSSIGRIAGAWQLNQPTPSAPNTAAPLASSTNLAINEWMANPLPGADDWIEIYNRSATQPVALRGIYLGISNALSQINGLSFIAPGGHVQLFADEGAGANHLNFRLPPTGTALSLYDEAGVERDRVSFGPQTQGVTQGRLPDGAASIMPFPASQSPAAPNYLLNYSGPLLNEVLAVNRAAATNANGRSADFVELRNPNGTAFDLSGFRLSNDPDDAGQWFFPSNTTIPGNGFLTVWFDNERPGSTVAGPVLNTGRSVDGEGGEIWLFNAAGVPVDSVVFGFQVADLPMGRSGSNWVLLTTATPGTANASPATLGLATSLRLNEWMAEPLVGADWFEIHNSSHLPISLTGLLLADHPMSTGLMDAPIGALSFIGGYGFVKVIADGQPKDGYNHTSFNLDGEGETLRLTSPTLGVIDTVYFGAQTPGVSQGRLPDGASIVVSFPATASPAGPNYLPVPGAVINEVLTRAAAPMEDAIEIYNPTGQGIDLSGWFLSDQSGDFKKYRIPDGTSLAAGGYRVFYESQFNHGGPGSFVLDGAREGQVFLSEADAAGNLSGFRSVERFGAAEMGIPFGQFATCVGLDFTAMSHPTFGQDAPASVEQFRTGLGTFNAYPKVGPVVINELMYHPPDLVDTNDNTLDEFVELLNLSSNAVPLYDPIHSGNTWQLRGGIEFLFPTNLSLPVGGSLLVVSFNPASNPAQLALFRALYDVPAGVPILGPYHGKLDNAGESVELLRPDAPQPDDRIPYLLIDRVAYGDTAPWPVAGDGDGASLQRRIGADYGNDPMNWDAGGPTAGSANPTSPALPPTIIVQPLSRTVPPNSHVVFTVAACGARPLSYQWQLDGGDIPGATEPALALTAVTAGLYSVIVSNSAGVTSSVPANLTLLALPIITTQPAPQSAPGSGSATFTVGASGPGPLTYQWRRNGSGLPGATSSNLVLNSLQATDNGDYSVVVGNPAGSIASAVAHLTVLIPPRILTQPQSQVVSPGVNVALTVAATGLGTVRYQWQFNGSNIENATNDTLVLINAQLANEGDYRVLVTDDIATIPSSVARLTVKVAPVILVAPKGATNVVGSDITLTVTARGSVPMGFEWRKGSLPVTNMVLMTTNSSFTLFNVTTNASGSYRVVITNSGSVSPVGSALVSVLVLAPPVITSQPVNRFAEAGGMANFSVTAGGSAPLSYQWYFKNNSLGDATNATLSLTNVQAVNEGGYFVIVTNLAGAVTSSVANLTLTGPLTITSHPQDLEVVAGSNATFSVTAEGAAPLSYQWRFNAGDLAGKTNMTLVLSNAQPAHAGLYAAVVSNSSGSVTSQVALLTVLAPPTLSEPEYLPGGLFQFKIQGNTNRTYFIEVSTNVTDWTTLTNFLYTNGFMPFADPTSAGVTNRLYRARLAQ